MKSIPKRKNPMIIVAASGLLSMTMGATNAYAVEAAQDTTEADTNAKAEQYSPEEAKGAIAALTKYDVNETKFLKNNGIIIGGWGNAGITYNANDPSNGFNGPVTFGDRSSEFQLNQLNMFIQKAVATEGNEWSFGGRFDAMFGTDSIFTQAYGVPAFDINTAEAKSRSNWDLNILGTGGNRFYGIALPQAYAESYIPIGNGLNVKAGHFYTPIGYETVPAPDNFFYTHAYTMQYGEPFTHTGIMGNYTVNKNWAVMGGVITGSETGGWDGNFTAQLGNWAGLGGLTFTANNGSSINVSGTYGGVSETNPGMWAMFSVVAKHNFTAKDHLVLQHDHGYAEGVLPGVKVAEWYGINSHLYHDLRDDLTIGLRAEWFRDQDGFRVFSPGRPFSPTGTSIAGASYYEVTAGLTWKPKSWLQLRPNIRYDIVDDTNATAGALPFGPSKNKYDQFVFSTDVTVKF